MDEMQQNDALFHSKKLVLNITKFKIINFLSIYSFQIKTTDCFPFLKRKVIVYTEFHAIV